MIIMQEIEYTQIDGKHGRNGWKGGNTDYLMVIMYQIEFTQIDPDHGWNGWEGY